MRPEGGMPLQVRLSDGLGVGVFIERDQVSIGVEDGKLFSTPWFACQRGIRMHYGLAMALGV